MSWPKALQTHNPALTTARSRVESFRSVVTSLFLTRRKMNVYRTIFDCAGAHDRGDLPRTRFPSPFFSAFRHADGSHDGQGINPGLFLCGCKTVSEPDRHSDAISANDSGKTQPGCTKHSH